MIRIHFTAADFARVRFAPRPAPLQELHATLSTLLARHDGLLLDRWRRRLLRSLPAAAAPLADLVPAGAAPRFLDVYEDGLGEALDAVRAAPRRLVGAELERVYAASPGAPPPWVRGLRRGDAEAWDVLGRAQRAAFETVLGPVWDVVRDLHAAEFARYAVAVAEGGVAPALTSLLPAARLTASTLELPGPAPDEEVSLDGRGLILLPTFHWTGRPLLCRPPDGAPPALTYPAGPGLPPSPSGTPDGLAALLGRTRLDALLLLSDEHSTSGLARRLGVSNATASAHAAALRAAGLITTARTGRSVTHHRTPLGTLLVSHRT
ncbi:ArsR family transcriptional regulator [Streptomyces caatingaensis]|uniref:Regulator n=1 Tax=Streptomyces caatingaensis TaxID=1678637 RepID=A0A0K9XDT9_9ACTN|nr:ArsR family transcriptional regulator [Streptomyces caatingaensis]KNB51408.1 regulator [Streptomyces caatingaensis]